MPAIFSYCTIGILFGLAIGKISVVNGLLKLAATIFTPSRLHPVLVTPTAYVGALSWNVMDFYGTVAPFDTGRPCLCTAEVIVTLSGAFVSATVTLNEPSASFPATSFALHMTVVIPIGNVEPEAGVQVGGILPSTLSIAVAVYVTVAPLGLWASIV